MLNEEEVVTATAWLALGNARIRKTINKKVNSYTLKHLIEKEMNRYISNESCIEAFKRFGFRAQRIGDTPNYWFNIAFVKE
jgi:hypothetical protein